VLLVDDSDLTRNLVRRMIEHLGCAVLEARTPSHALKFLDQDAPIDLLVADFNLTGMTGPGLCDHLARRGRPVPALYYSSSEGLSGRGLRAH